MSAQGEGPFDAADRQHARSVFTTRYFGGIGLADVPVVIAEFSQQSSDAFSACSACRQGTAAVNTGYIGRGSGNGGNVLRHTGMTGFVICSIVFIADVLAGKAAMLFGFDASFRLGVVAEFLVLFAAAAFFVAAALASEQIRDDRFEKTTN